MRRHPADDEFFIGYTTMPVGLRRFVSSVVVTVGAGAALWGILLVAGHRTVDGGTFSYGRPEGFKGVVTARPYPALVRPDGTMQLLVAQGKHGADELLRDGDGRRISLVGTRIRRGDRTMIEIVPDSIVLGDLATLPSALVESGPESVELTGEIVDTKCHLGVMVPGDGRTHRACASLCLRGGIPPALFVQDRHGPSSLVLLVGSRGEPLNAPAARAAGRVIRLTGEVGWLHQWRLMRTDPASWRLLAAED